MSNIDPQSNSKIVDNYFWFLEKKLSLSSPVNLKQEKINFFNSNYTYNPQFIYSSPPAFKFEKQINKLIKKVGNPEIRQLYLDKFKEYRLRRDLIKSVGSSTKFANLSIQLYGKPNQQTLAIARKIVDQMPRINYDRKNINIIRFKRLKKEIRSYIKNNDLHGKIKIRHQHSVGNNVSVSKTTGRITISDNYIADKDELNDILYHELETHMRRLENGSKQDYGIFKIGTAKYLACEEGLAPIVGHIFKKNQLMWHPALLVIAMQKSLESDFISVFKLINSIIKEPFQSWSYTVRVKNGIGDTSQPGAFTKDLYLQYVIKVAKQIVDNPKLLTTAFNGKASLVQLNNFTKTLDNFESKIKTKEILNLAKLNHFPII